MAREGAPTAPPVVAVVVTHQPGEWFGAVLASFARQDYPNLSFLFLDAASADDPSATITAALPGAVVRRLDADRGYGASANEALKLVEGNAFFLFLHDDLALDPSAVRLLVEEAYRSNAAVVGPKLVDWYDERRLLQVGVTVDKFGVLAPYAERGELDQEQHDAVRDVFALPGGALLVRADLFRALGGFDEGIDFEGDDLDLCWRAHVAGARVLVVPAARGRHVEAFLERRAVDDRDRLQSRHRLRTVLAGYSGLTLLRIVPQMIVLNIVEFVLALVTGRTRRARDVVGAWTWNLRRLGEIQSKRKALARQRQVPDYELRNLQARGSARLTAFLRGQAHRSEFASPLQSAAATGREFITSLRARSQRASWLVWVAALVVFVVGSRRLFGSGVAPVGEFVRLGESPVSLVRSYLSGWRPAGLGREGSAPTSIGALALAGFATLAHMELVRTLLATVPLLVGWIGMWRLTRPLAVPRARLAGLLVYAAVPVGMNAIAQGELQALIVYAAVPWAVARLARLAQLAPFGSRRGETGPDVPERSFTAQVLGLGLVVAAAAIFAPVMAAVVVVIAVALALGSLVVGGFVPALRAVGGAVLAVVVAFVLHLPWSLDLLTNPSWDGLVAIAPAGPTGRALTDLLRFDTGPVDPSFVGFAFVVIAGLALTVGRQWRLAWAGRAWFVALVFFGLAWAGERHWITVGLPRLELLLAPAACGLALAAAAGGAAFEIDVRGSRFSWRQVVSIAAAVLVVFGVVPAVAAAGDGRWNAPASGLPRTLGFLAEREADGPYRVLWLGDPRVMPVRGWVLADGLEFGLTQGATATLDDLWPGDAGRGVEKVREALSFAGGDQTARLGRLLAPMAVRYVVVPNRIAPSFEGVDEFAAPDSIDQMLAGQLDLRRLDVDEAVDVYENQAWLPGRALLTGASSGAAGQTGFAPLVTTDLSANPSVLSATSTPQRFTGTAGPGELFVSQSSSDQWELTLDGRSIARRPAFGWANVFTLDQAGKVTLAYDTPVTRTVAVVVQLLLWLVALRLVWRAATRASRPAWIADTELDATAADAGTTDAGASGATGTADVEVDAAGRPVEGSPAAVAAVGTDDEVIREPRPIRREPARPALGPETLTAEDLPWLAHPEDRPGGGEEQP